MGKTKIGKSLLYSFFLIMALAIVSALFIGVWRFNEESAKASRYRMFSAVENLSDYMGYRGKFLYLPTKIYTENLLTTMKPSLMPDIGHAYASQAIVYLGNDDKIHIVLADQQGKIIAKID